MSPFEKAVESVRTYGPAGIGLLRGVVEEYGVRPVLEAVHNLQPHEVPLNPQVVELELPPADNLREAA